MNMNPQVDLYFTKLKKWQKECALLRKILLSCELTEELKWGVPCYTVGGKNVVLIHGFKEYCALLFMKGALLQDTNGILIQQTENVQSGRQIRFTSIEQITASKVTLKAYVNEAIKVEKLGLKVDFKKSTRFTLPDELQHKLDENIHLKTAFEALTPGRQRAYYLYFSGAKQAKTRQARVDKCIPQILEGRGLND